LIDLVRIQREQLAWCHCRAWK